MLVCPQCQFDNPDSHKFCQKCGASLTEKTCPNCEALVPFDAQQCQACGTTTGTFWRAVFSNSTDSDEQSSTTPTASATSEAASTAAITAGSYLDTQHRYQLLEPLPQPPATGTEVQVLDCQPFQPSLLNIAYSQPDALEVGEDDSNENDGGLNAKMLTIPPVVKTYLTLRSVNSSLPQIHDAWEQDGHSVILLQDRAALPTLLDLWSSEQVLPIQILHWLYEMIELWDVLHPQHCAQSLLEIGNLRVDEDQLLCLQRLYTDNPHNPPSLNDLGRMWQILFQKSQRTQFGALAHLCYDLESGSITTIEQLRSRFEAIADELQASYYPPNPETETELTASSAQPLTMGDSSAKDNPVVHSALASPMSASPSGTEPDPLLPEDNRPVEVENKLPDSLAHFEEDSDDELTGDSDDAPTVVLPMRLIGIEDAGRTDIGRQREHNEDYFTIKTEVCKLESPQGRLLQAKGLYILCDGMGGHAGGEVASALAVDTLKQYFETHWENGLPSEEQIREAIVQANLAIYSLNQQNSRSGSGRMGTTLVMVLIHNTEAAIAHVGDSRLYRFSRRCGLEQITVDHEVGQREIQRGVEPAIAYARPDAYQLTQALGPRDENFINPDIQFLELNEDLLLLLCSDGLTDNDLLETHWRTHVEPLLSSQSSLEHGVNQLVELANHYNGHDNITAVAIRTKVRPNLDGLSRG